MTKDIYKKAMACVPKDAVPEFWFNNVYHCDPKDDGSLIFFDEASEMFTIIRTNKLNQADHENQWQVRFTSLEVLEHVNFPLKTAEVVNMVDKIPGILFGGMSLDEAKKMLKTHPINKTTSPYPTVRTGNEKKVAKISKGSTVEPVKDPYLNIKNGTYRPPYEVPVKNM